MEETDDNRKYYANPGREVRQTAAKTCIANPINMKSGRLYIGDEKAASRWVSMISRLHGLSSHAKRNSWAMIASAGEQ